jgi:hypothetical protein
MENRSNHVTRNTTMRIHRSVGRPDSKGGAQVEEIKRLMNNNVPERTILTATVNLLDTLFTGNMAMIERIEYLEEEVSCLKTRKDTSTR